MNPSEHSAREDSAHLREVSVGAMAALAFKSLGFISSFALSVVVARLYGLQASGLFFLALTIVIVASTLPRFGSDKSLVREVAGLEAIGDRSSLRSVVLLTVIFVGIASTIIAVGLFLATPWLGSVVFGQPDLVPGLRWMVWAIPPVAIATVISFAFQGLKHIAMHVLLLTVLTPATAVVLIFTSQGTDQGRSAYELYFFASLLTLVLAVLAWFTGWRRQRVELGLQRLLPIARSSVDMSVIMAAQLVMAWAPTMLLGMNGSSSEVGLFHSAARTAFLISFVLIAVNSIVAPKFAAMHRLGQMDAARALAFRSTLIMTLAAIPIAGALVIWPERAMLLFGPEFVEGGHLLRILGIGQFVSTASGSVAILLLMTGHERDFRNVCLVGASLCLLPGSWVIANYGGVGAAWVASGVLIVVNLLAARAAFRRLGFTGLFGGR